MYRINAMASDGGLATALLCSSSNTHYECAPVIHKTVLQPVFQQIITRRQYVKKVMSNIIPNIQP